MSHNTTKWRRYNRLDLQMGIQTRLSTQRANWRVTVERSDHPTYPAYAQATMPVPHTQRSLAVKVPLTEANLTLPMHELASPVTDEIVRKIDAAIKQLADQGIDSFRVIAPASSGVPTSRGA